MVRRAQRGVDMPTAQEANSVIEQTVNRDLNKITQEIESRAFRASNELANAIIYILRGQRSGKRYKIPGTYRKHADGTGRMIKKRNGVYYTASAPGEAPANRTGMFRASWKRRSFATRLSGRLEVTASIESNLKVGSKLLGDVLEKGSKRGLAPRPYKQAVIDRAMPRIDIIYRKPYL